MKLSDFTGDKAVEVLADIMIPASTIMADEGFKEMVKKGTSYMNIAGYILKQHKSAVLDMYEPLMQESREKATPIKLIQLIMDIVQDPELSNLFTSQGQQETLTSSGSAMASTEDGLK